MKVGDLIKCLCNGLSGVILEIHDEFPTLDYIVLQSDGTVEEWGEDEIEVIS